MSNINITNIKYMDLSHKNIIVTFTCDNSDCGTFSFNIDDTTNNADPNDSQFSKDYIVKQLAIEKINSGEIVPDAPDLPGFIESYMIRSSRDKLLADTDKYFSVSDYPITEESKQALREYRQSLRDITEQEDFPTNVIWPAIPEVVSLKKSKQ